MKSHNMEMYIMSHKKFGKWIIKDKLYIQIKIANELWTYSRKDGSGEKQTHLFFVGWYDKDGQQSKMFTVNILWVSFQLGTIWF